MEIPKKEVKGNDKMACYEKNGSELYTESLVIGDGQIRKVPKRGRKKIDPWDGEWKKQEDFYFPFLGEESMDFLLSLIGYSP